MIARALVVAEADSGGVTRLTRLRSDGPLVLRSTPNALYLVGGAAGPLGGDRWHLQIEVRAGARLVMHSVAASIALPGPSGRQSCLHLEADVAAGASLRWLPEPLVAGAGCRHRTESTVRVSADANLIWREELILGRHNEACGSLSARVDVELAGAALLRNALAIGPESPGWDGPAVTGGMKAVGSLLIAGQSLGGKTPAAKSLDKHTWAMPLSGPAIYIGSLAEQGRSLRQNLDRAMAECSIPEIGRSPRATGRSECGSFSGSGPAP